jgi:hypothetical protein
MCVYVCMNGMDMYVHDTVRVWAKEAGLGPAIVAGATCGIATGVCVFGCMYVCMHE